MPIPSPNAPATPTPTPAASAAFVADNLSLGVVGDGKNLAIAFLFVDAQGRECPPIILTNDGGAIGDDLAAAFSTVVARVRPDEVQEVVSCRVCGRRIFGAIATKGACLTCEPIK